MITTVSLNPSIDKSLTVEAFQYGSMNRVVDGRLDAGGKAINVAVVAAGLGIRVRCVGFLRMDNGKFVENRLHEHGVTAEHIWLDGSVRTNLKLLDASRSVVTEINEPGDPVTELEIEEVTRLIVRSAGDSDYLVLTGSLPPGCPKAFYARIIGALNGSNCRCLLDAEGEALRLGIAAVPYMIKPNRMELELEVGRTLGDVLDVASAALRFVDRGTPRVAVSLGADGALLAGADGVFFAPRVAVPVVSTVGAGDSMVAGMLKGLMEGMPSEDILRYGVACATASVTERGTRLADGASFQRMLGQIRVERVHV